MNPQYYILRPDMRATLGGPCNAEGPFATIAEARKSIRDSAAELFADSDKSLRQAEGDWADPEYIVQVVAAIRPCPKAEISVRLTSVPLS